MFSWFSKDGGQFEFSLKNSLKTQQYSLRKDSGNALYQYSFVYQYENIGVRLLIQNPKNLQLKYLM